MGEEMAELLEDMPQLEPDKEALKQRRMGAHQVL